jgi:hypothetical protein
MVVASGCEVEPYPLSETAYQDGSTADGDGGDGGPATDGTPTDARPPCIPPGTPEVCNELDDDCDGLIDEDFDLSNDPFNCGECGNICAEPNADVVCQAGECVRLNCWVGYKDLDPDEPGCEYRCPVYPETPEDCNGIDEDCDGETDEPADLVAPPADLCRDTAGTPCENVAPVCATRGNPPVTTWYCDYPPQVEFDPDLPNGIVLQETLCDGHDGDCDGVADDPFTDLGQTCDNGAMGACRDVGIRACDPNDATQTYCDFSVLPDPDPLAPRPEMCNGVDDDCDGIVDNPDTNDASRVIDDMVHIQRNGLDFWIYRYEASRPDATETAVGISEARACSKPGALPWAGVTYAQAAAACQVVGKRLCTAEEWAAACAGPANHLYPYGATYGPDTCNGHDLDGIPGGDDDDVLLPTADSSLLAGCVSAEGIHDLSGNVREWTDDPRGTTADGTPIYVVRGGGFTTPSIGLTCDFEISQAVADVVLETIGFRCCSHEAP